jgi:hypothetical protein
MPLNSVDADSVSAAWLLTRGMGMRVENCEQGRGDEIPSYWLIALQGVMVRPAAVDDRGMRDATEGGGNLIAGLISEVARRGLRRVPDMDEGSWQAARL